MSKLTWNMGCGHFDAFDDPSHDCSTWGDDDAEDNEDE